MAYGIAISTKAHSCTYNIMYYLLVVAQKYDVFLRFNQVIIFVIAVLYCVVNYRFLNQTLFRLLLNRPARPQHTRQQGQVFQTAVCVCCTLLHVDDDDGYEQLLHWIDLSRNERGSDQQLFVLWTIDDQIREIGFPVNYDPFGCEWHSLLGFTCIDWIALYFALFSLRWIAEWTTSR